MKTDMFGAFLDALPWSKKPAVPERTHADLTVYVRNRLHTVQQAEDILDIMLVLQHAEPVYEPLRPSESHISRAQFFALPDHLKLYFQPKDVSVQILRPSGLMG